MLDTHARKWVEPTIASGANILHRIGLTANQVTMISFLIGLSTSGFILVNKPIVAVILLWLSGYLDAVDGSLARRFDKPSAVGTLMDITFDRVVELGMILSIAYMRIDARLGLVYLACAIILSMTVFLTVGALADQKGGKSFYYQAGMMERTEGFIGFTLMILLPNHVVWISTIMSTLILFTGIQRFNEARKLL
tara:strand:- start:159 stop:740 length:582 start_codon:yes stop_codon:yes gene_type:complete